MNAVSPLAGEYSRSWLAAYKWLLARRLVQIGVVALFFIGPLTGYWFVKGNLAASLTLDWLPLTDPLIFLQSVLAGHVPESSAVIGAFIVAVFYAVVGGRVYCAWVCPVNIVADVAAWLRQRLRINGPGIRLRRELRLWLLALALLLSAATGTIAWEFVNPVTLVFRGLVFGAVGAVFAAAAILLFDTIVARRGWCGHLCPVGAAYGLLGARSPLKIAATRRDQCNDCMDCFAVCPEPHVIKPALKGAAQGFGPVIASADCSNCGRCIDVCERQVFEFKLRKPLAGI